MFIFNKLILNELKQFASDQELTSSAHKQGGIRPIRDKECIDVCKNSNRMVKSYAIMENVKIFFILYAQPIHQNACLWWFCCKFKQAFVGKIWQPLWRSNRCSCQTSSWKLRQMSLERLIYSRINSLLMLWNGLVYVRFQDLVIFSE